RRRPGQRGVHAAHGARMPTLRTHGRRPALPSSSLVGFVAGQPVKNVGRHRRQQLAETAHSLVSYTGLQPPPGEKTVTT
ncbi:MAG: hypothetical protein ACOCTG_06420, partial [Bacteroidota bacterium]